jgi:predicted transposase/invertase (TIGR01784 family)
METDSFFWQLLKKLPDTLFALLGLPPDRAANYRFDAVEIKKSYRLDGLFVPTLRNLPVYIVEVQFRRDKRFFPNLFAKVFSYLEANDPDQDWRAVAIFVDRKTEPKPQPGYKFLLESAQVRRIYLDELEVPDNAAPGVKLLQLVSAPESETRERVSKLIRESRQEFDCEHSNVIVELMEELLMRRFKEMNREEIRQMFQLHDLRESKVWQEAHKEGKDEGKDEGKEEGRMLEKQDLVKRWHAKGKTIKEIAELLEIPAVEVRRMARGGK